MRKSKYGGYPCACGKCGRLTSKGRYAAWHIRNPVPELVRPCACNCGGFTRGTIDQDTREPKRYIAQHNGQYAKDKCIYECVCGRCGYKTSRPGMYADWHRKHSCEWLKTECRCGCKNMTNGIISPTTNLPNEYILYHGSKGRPSAVKGKKIYRNADEYCKCGCLRKAWKNGYAHSHVQEAVPELVKPCACGQCGQMTSGRIKPTDGTPIDYNVKCARNSFRRGDGGWGDRKTSIEILVENELIELRIDYIFDQKFHFWYPDFRMPDRKLIIEADGEYWHSKPENILRDKVKDAYYTGCGYKVVRLKEADIKRNARAVVLAALGY
jgi:hypothetical protein